MSTLPQVPLRSEDEILDFLAQYERKELLRFVTIGSVDDGKSTLIGRILYEAGGVYEDQLEAVTCVDADGREQINFANLTDGLVAEREQGITIDVAYRYFSTPKRKFIIADTPGHVQYTRNMATGASTADAAIILIDARLGVLQQSRRHAYIANLLGIPHLLVAVNKMDLVDFDREVFETIQAEFRNFTGELAFERVDFFPVSALEGDNVVERSHRTPWWDGRPLLTHLEQMPIPDRVGEGPLVLPVQYVLRPDLHYRGFAGTISGGVVRPGDEIAVLPSGKRSRVKSIDTKDGPLQEAFAPMSVAITLEDEIDVSRGDVLTAPDNPLHISRRVEADLVWLDETPLDTGRQYLVKHTSNLVSGSISRLHARMDLDALQEVPTETLELNDIGRVELDLNRPIIMREYVEDRTLGSFILIDRVSNATVAAGMLRAHGEDFQHDRETVNRALTPQDRSERFGQKPTVLLFTGRAGVGKIVIARALERRLFEAGHMPFVFEPHVTPRVDRQAQGKLIDPLLDYVELAVENGLVAIVAFSVPARFDRARFRERFVERAEFVEVFFQAELETCRSRLAALGRDPNECDLAYEAPIDPDVVVSGDELHIDAEVDRLVRTLERRGAIRGRGETT